MLNAHFLPKKTLPNRRILALAVFSALSLMLAPRVTYQDDGMTGCIMELSQKVSTDPDRLRKNQPSPGIPRIIWMFWDSGWPSNKPDANLALYSFVHANPNYEIRPINLLEAERYTQREKVVPNATWNQLTIQAKSDIYRTLLLYEHGGIWADASLVCSVPLDTWLTVDHHVDLVSFLRKDISRSPKRLQKKIDPWITSWFLAAPPKSYTIRAIREIISDPTQHNRFHQEYYWWHRIVSDLSQSDIRVGNRTRNFPPADPLHCKPYSNIYEAPMYKRCANKNMFSIMATTRRCCAEAQPTHWLSRRIGPPPNTKWWIKVCKDWQCYNQSHNMMAPNLEQMERAWGNNDTLLNEIMREKYRVV